MMWNWNMVSNIIKAIIEYTYYIYSALLLFCSENVLQFDFFAFIS